MIEQHTLVIDCDDMSSDSDNSHMAFSVIVPNIRIIRRYRQFNVGASASTIVDFQASTLAVDPFCQDMRCERYVVPNLAYARQDWSSRKISKLMNASYQSVAAISFDKIKGLTNRTPKEVVLLFLENEAAGLDEAFLLIRSGCHSIMSASRLPPKITFVGLRADDRRGDSLEEELEEYTSQGWPALQMDPSWFRFLSHTEYREKVGEEQYALETNKSATVLEGARSALPNIDSLLA
ncbi:hypothetical protein CspeluHIS016_0302040 [Cutaneotrichosporon spelunceum]|uniref:Uncharacterized protein n=1 Tax=Cutaneotrichosporon spelunceum TaxID=1672016 RepID=A0AAD3YC14_9TREE|nr:hypothetical protein CspeluHIS016_0302040 [Cutaneotrichosporon spelunceum]